MTIYRRMYDSLIIHYFITKIFYKNSKYKLFKLGNNENEIEGARQDISAILL